MTGATPVVVAAVVVEPGAAVEPKVMEELFPTQLLSAITICQGYKTT